MLILFLELLFKPSSIALLQAQTKLDFIHIEGNSMLSNFIAISVLVFQGLLSLSF